MLKKPYLAVVGVSLGLTCLVSAQEKKEATASGAAPAAAPAAAPKTEASAALKDPSKATE